MNIRLNTKVSAITVLSAALILGLSSATIQQFRTAQASTEAVGIYHSALRNHLECDRMHDALRADVLAAIRAGGKTEGEERQTVRDDTAKHIKLFREKLKERENLALSPTIKTALQGVKEPLNTYVDLADGMVKVGLESPASAEAQMPTFLVQFRELEAAMSNLSDLVESAGQEMEKVNRSNAEAFFSKVYYLGGLAILVLIILTGVVVRSIPRPFKKLADDLSHAAEMVTESSQGLAKASQEVADSASNQAASLEETSASLEEMSSMTKRNSDNSAEANAVSAQTRAAADNGMRSMALMRQAMMDIKSASDNIGRIIKSIDEIAFQTNILALNAAVEAARAGEAGMGFAVVADEVRTLAQRSALAARETNEKIEDCILKSNRGVEICETVAKSLQEIASQASSMDALVSEISTASKEQSVGISQINTAVSQMDKVTQANAESAANSAAGAQQLKDRATFLRETVLELNRLVDGSGHGSTQRTASTPRLVSAVHDPEVAGAAAPKRGSAPATTIRGTTPRETKAAQARQAEASFPMPKESAASPDPATVDADSFKNF